MAETPFEREVPQRRLPASVSRLWSVAARWELALGLILLLGLGLRMHGIDWDQPEGALVPLQMHPDERFLSLVSDRLDWPESVGGYFDTASSPLNPYNDPETHSYVYGTFPLFLVKGAATMAGRLPDTFLGLDMPDEYADRAGPGNSYDRDILWGRRITALFDTATIALVFALGCTLFSRKTGLLAALFYALAVLPTQLAHFWTMDPYVTFFGAATLLIAARTLRDEAQMRRPTLRLLALYSLLGLTVGLGLASKVTAWPLLLAPLLSVAIRVGLRDLPRLGLRWHGEKPTLRGHWTSDISLLCLALAVAMIVFRVAQPYAFAGPNFWDMNLNPTWRADIEREVDFQNGNVDYPPFVQFAGRSPFLTPLKNLVVWGLGPALGLTALAAAVAASTVVFRRRELTFVMPLAFAGAVFLFQGPRFVAFMRYFEPIYPVLCLLAAWALLEIWQRRPIGAGGRHRVPSWVPQRLYPSRRAVSGTTVALVLGVIGLTVFWATAFQSIYTQGHPRITASEWLYANAPPGSRITGEIWDDTLPYSIPG
ncbi:MAG: glycosyltransferase family 39 protein, partial [Tepidiformaceae bacterium]